MTFYAGPPRVRHGSHIDRAAAMAERDALRAEGHNAWVELEKWTGLVVYSLARRTPSASEGNQK